MQVEVPNHLKVLWTKAMVLRVKEKAVQELSGKYEGDEWPYKPLTKMSKEERFHQNQIFSLIWDKSGGNLFTGQAVGGIEVA